MRAPQTLKTPAARLPPLARPAAVSFAFACLTVAALAGFWKPYLSQLLAPQAAPMPTLLHLHVAGMALWCLLLVAQPALVRAGRRRLHRQLGRVAWVLAPGIVVGSLLLAVAMNRPAAGAAIEPFRYGLFFVQLAGAATFGLCVALALARRHDAALHARWMIGSGITFIDPVFARVFAHLGPPWPALEAYGSMLLADLVLLALILGERAAHRGRGVFPVLLVLLLAAQAGGLWIDAWPPWRRWMEAVLG